MPSVDERSSESPTVATLEEERVVEDVLDVADLALPGTPSQDDSPTPQQEVETTSPAQGEPTGTPSTPLQPQSEPIASQIPVPVHTPKRKLEDAFPDTDAEGEASKVPRLEQTAASATDVHSPASAPESVPAVKAVKLVSRLPGPKLVRPTPRPRPDMLGSLSPESNVTLARLIGPSASAPTRINIDFSRHMPSFAAAEAAMRDDPPSPSRERSTSPPRGLAAGASAVVLSPGLPRRALFSPSPPPSPTRVVGPCTTAPSTSHATQTALPFPLGAPSAPDADQKLQSSPVKGMLQPVEGDPALDVDVAMDSASVPSNPAKPSQLRQPVARAISKLPMPKPYSRLPAPSTGAHATTKQSSVGTPTASRVTPSSHSNSSSTPRAAKGAAASSAPMKSLLATHHQQHGAASTSSPRKAPVHAADATAAAPPIVIRQVIPGTLGGQLRAGASKQPQPSSETGEKAPIPIRQVVKGSLRPGEGRGTPASPEKPKEQEQGSRFSQQPASSPHKPVMVRKVIPGTLRDYKGRPASPPPAPASELPSPQKSPPKKQGTIMVRQVVPGTLRDYKGRPATPRDTSPEMSSSPLPARPIERATFEPPSAPMFMARSPSPQSSPIHAPVASRAGNRNLGLLALTGIGVLSSPDALGSPSPPLPRSSPPTSPVVTAAPADIVLPVVPPMLAADSSPTSGSVPRRTSRSRTKPAPSVSSSVTQSIVLPTSIVALRAITQENTGRNEVWAVADIETVIVRRPGPRPESPSSKMKSVAEKRREAADRQREKRAKRRAGEGDDEEDDELRHIRGPGDDEDFITPQRLRQRPRAVHWDPDLISTPLRKAEDERQIVGKSILTPGPHYVSFLARGFRDAFG